MANSPAVRRPWISSRVESCLLDRDLLMFSLRATGWKKKRAGWLTSRRGVPLLSYFEVLFTGAYNNHDLIWCVKTAVYMGFWVHRGF